VDPVSLRRNQEQPLAALSCELPNRKPPKGTVAVVAPWMIDARAGAPVAGEGKAFVAEEGGAGGVRRCWRMLLPASGPIAVVSVIGQRTNIWNDVLIGAIFGGTSQPMAVALNNSSRPRPA
jgi:hypothetical protein